MLQLPVPLNKYKLNDNPLPLDSCHVRDDDNDNDNNKGYLCLYTCRSGLIINLVRRTLDDERAAVDATLDELGVVCGVGEVKRLQEVVDTWVVLDLPLAWGVTEVRRVREKTSIVLF